LSLVNYQLPFWVILRAMGVLDNLSNATASLDRAIQATDKSVNADLLPDVADHVKTYFFEHPPE
jgi:hypothetical protein